MNSKDFLTKLEEVQKLNTIYAKGCFGQPLNESNLTQKSKQYKSWYSTKLDKFKSLIGKNYFMFDCMGLVKGVIWGFSGDPKKEFGGAEYESNGLPDCTEAQMIKLCKEVSTDFSKIVAGELLYMSGHVGVYFGNGKVIECTSGYTGNVCYTNLKDRKWLKHGKLPMINYEAIPSNPTNKTKSLDEIAREVIKGSWGNGSERKKRLTLAGYDYRAVQNLVNKLLK